MHLPIRLKHLLDKGWLRFRRRLTQTQAQLPAANVLEEPFSVPEQTQYTLFLDDVIDIRPDYISINIIRCIFGLCNAIWIVNAESSHKPPRELSTSYSLFDQTYLRHPAFRTLTLKRETIPYSSTGALTTRHSAVDLFKLTDRLLGSQQNHTVKFPGEAWNVRSRLRIA